MPINRREFVRKSIAGSLAFPLIGLPYTSVNQTPAKCSVTSDIIYTPVFKLIELVKSKQISSFEIVSAFIDRIEKVNPLINAVVAFRPEQALQEARIFDNDFIKGKVKGILHGLPCTVKDSFNTKGIISTAGTLGRANYLPDQDAMVVQRLKNAGAIILGKTNTSELTMEFFTDNKVYGKTKNPYNLKHTPGGSSGGAAAIIAAGGSPFDIGTDTGGSIRFPAHCCGIYGLKPTAGRVPRTGHIIEFRGAPQFLTQVGPMATNIEDLDLLHRIIAGPDNIDPYTYPVPIKDHNEVDLKKLKIAFFFDNKIAKPSDEIISTIKYAVNILSEEGLNIEENLPKGIDATAELSYNMINTGDWIKRLLEKCGTTETTLSWALSPREISGSEYNKLQERIDDYKSSMLNFWNNYDVLVCPVSPATAQRLDTPYEGEDYYSYTSAYNITGWPAVVIPGSLSKQNLPIGIQIVAPPWREETAIALAKFLDVRLVKTKPPEF